MSLTEKPTNVIEALARVSAQVGAIEKLRTPNAGPKYDYRGIEDVLNSLHGPLRDNGVVIVPRVTNPVVVDRPNFGKDGGLEAQMTVEYRIYGPGGLQDFVDAAVFATGIDTGDKGSGKAMSYAYKSLAFQLLCIPTDVVEDNEANPVARNGHAEPRPTINNHARGTSKGAAEASEAAIKIMAEVLECDDPVNAPPPEVEITPWMWQLAGETEESLDIVPWEKLGKVAGVQPTDLLDRAQGIARKLKAGSTPNAHVPDRLDEIHGAVAVELRRFLLSSDLAF